jgi:hypothetical protein
MTSKSSVLTTFLTLYLFLSGSAEEGGSVKQASNEWQAHVYKPKSNAFVSPVSGEDLFQI